MSTSSQATAAGIDVGADRLHLVVLDAALEVRSATVLDPGDTHGFHSWMASLAPGSTVAIDGPDGPSSAPHRDDLTLAPKWRTARGCEVALGQQRGIWVSWATPERWDEMAPWMQVASGLFTALRSCAHIPLETYPHAVFRTLIGTRPPKKTSALGISARVDALRGAGVTEPTLAMWSHDALDAAAAALVAAHHRAGTAEPVRDATDGTAVWLPPRPSVSQSVIRR